MERPDNLKGVSSAFFTSGSTGTAVAAIGLGASMIESF